MTDKKTHCENLYQNFLDLKKKTHIDVEHFTSGKVPSPQAIKAEDLLKKEEIRQQLLHCKDSLSLKPEEWFEIENS